MKFIIIFLLFSITIQLHSQSVFTSKGISTNPDNPINPEKSEFNGIDYFWDWRKPDSNGYFHVRQNPDFNSNIVRSPFFTLARDYSFLPQVKGDSSDFEPADGWELVKYNLGYKMDGTHRQANILCPYIILYNKYSSVLRIFIAEDPKSYLNAAIITVSYLPPEGNQDIFYDGERYFASALLSHNNNVAQPLNEITEITDIGIPVAYMGYTQLFMWTDIPVAYDPCVCYYRSNLNIDIMLLKHSEITLTGTLLQPQSITKNKNDQEILFASQIVATIFHIAGASTIPNPVSYSLVAADVAKFIAMLTEPNSKIDANDKQMIKAFQKIINNTSMTIEDSLLYKGNAVKTFAGYADFFSASIAKLGNNTNSSAISNISTMKLSGTSQSSFNPKGDIIAFSTPGSFKSELNPEEQNFNDIDTFHNYRPEYTYYNEILGTFALLKKPKIEIYMTDSYDYTGLGDDAPDYNMYKRKVQYKVKNYPKSQIEYVFNPAADIDITKTKITAALEIHANVFENTYQHEFLLKNLKLIQTLKNQNNQDSIKIFVSPFVPLENIGNLVTELKLKEEWITQDCYPYYKTLFEGKVFLKFLIEYEFNSLGSDGKPNKSIQILKYPVIVDTVKNELNSYDTNTLIVEDTTFTFDKTFSTQKDIIIKKDITVKGNSTLILNVGRNLIIGNNISLNTEDNAQIIINISGNILGNNITLLPNILINYRKTPYLFDHLIPPITDKNYLDNFCLNEYQAKYATSNNRKKIDLHNNNNNILKKSLSLNIYPNPITKTVQISYNLSQETDILVEIYDIYGKKVKQIEQTHKQAGTSQYYIDLSSLQNGIYFCILKTSQGVVSKKIIKM